LEPAHYQLTQLSVFGKIYFHIIIKEQRGLNVQSLYSKLIKLVGSTGRSRKEFRQIINMSKDFKVRIWKRFKLEDTKEALQALSSKETDGRILLDINSSIY
jgi:D-arabinose 1-dehydrogenase-like Zn-dependent alcohol dehydrogenase